MTTIEAPQQPQYDEELMRVRARIGSIPAEPFRQQLGDVAAELAKPVKIGIASATIAGGALAAAGLGNTAPAGASEAQTIVAPTPPASISPRLTPPMPAFAAEPSTVNPGDGYWRVISRNTSLSDPEIPEAIEIVKAVNSHAENHTLHPNDKLYVKFLDAIGMQAPAAVATNVETSVNYTAQKDDNVWDIARRFGVPLDKFIADNRLTDPSLIHPGQQFVIKKTQPVAPTPPTKPNYYQQVVTGQSSAAVITVPKGATDQQILDASSEESGIPAADLEPGFDKMNDLEPGKPLKKKTTVVVMPGLNPNFSDKVNAKLIEKLAPKPPVTSTTTTTEPAPTTTSTTEAPAPTTTSHSQTPTTTTASHEKSHDSIPPLPKGKSVSWEMKPNSLTVNQLAMIVGSIHKVTAPVALAWIEKANKDVDLSQLEDGAKLKLPGVSHAEWKQTWKAIEKMTAVIAWNKAVAAQVEAPGLINPPGMQQLSQNYWQQPASPSYNFAVNDANRHSGSKALVEFNYTMSSNWIKKHPDAKITIGDMNAAVGHASHENGVDVDITVEGGKAADMYKGSHAMNVELAKDIISTGGPGFIKKIFFCDRAVIAEVNKWAVENGYAGDIMEYWDNHETHFHVRIADKFRLATVANSPPPTIATTTTTAAPAQVHVKQKEVQPQPPAPESNPDNITLSAEESAEIDTFNIAPDQKAFLKLIIPVVRKISLDVPINPADVTAQIINESYWGRSAQGNNILGMKVDDGWHGPRQLLDTFEDDANGQRKPTKAWFKVYESPEACIRDYVRLIATAPHYADARAVKDNWRAFLHGLINEGEPKYATAVNYEEAISGLVEEFHLDKLTHTG